MFSSGIFPAIPIQGLAQEVSLAQEGAMPSAGPLPSFTGQSLEDALEFLGAGPWEILQEVPVREKSTEKHGAFLFSKDMNKIE